MGIFLFEYHLCKLGQIDAPVAPDVTSVSLTVDVFVAFLVEIAAKVGILLIEKVGGSDGYPIQLGVGCEQRGKLLLHFLVCLKDVIERLGLVAADVKTCREETLQ